MQQSKPYTARNEAVLELTPEAIIDLLSGRPEVILFAGRRLPEGTQVPRVAYDPSRHTLSFTLTHPDRLFFDIAEGCESPRLDPGDFLIHGLAGITDAELEKLLHQPTIREQLKIVARRILNFALEQL